MGNVYSIDENRYKQILEKYNDRQKLNPEEVKQLNYYRSQQAKGKSEKGWKELPQYVTLGMPYYKSLDYRKVKNTWTLMPHKSSAFPSGAFGQQEDGSFATSIKTNTGYETVVTNTAAEGQQIQQQVTESQNVQEAVKAAEQSGQSQVVTQGNQEYVVNPDGSFIAATPTQNEQRQIEQVQMQERLQEKINTGQDLVVGDVLRPGMEMPLTQENIAVINDIITKGTPSIPAEPRERPDSVIARPKEDTKNLTGTNLVNNFDLLAGLLSQQPKEKSATERFIQRLADPVKSVLRGTGKILSAEGKSLDKAGGLFGMLDVFNIEKSAAQALTGDTKGLANREAKRKDVMQPIMAARSDSDVIMAIQAGTLVAGAQTKVGSILLKGGLKIYQGYAGAQFLTERTPESAADLTWALLPDTKKIISKALDIQYTSYKALTSVSGKRAAIRGGRTIRTDSSTTKIVRTGLGKIKTTASYARTERGGRVLQDIKLDLIPKGQAQTMRGNAYTRPTSQVRTPGPYNVRNMGRVGTSTELQQLQRPNLTKQQRQIFRQEVIRQDLALKNPMYGQSGGTLLEKPLNSKPNYQPRQLPSSGGRERVRAQILEKLRMRQQQITNERVQRGVQDFFKASDQADASFRNRITAAPKQRVTYAEPAPKVPRGYMPPQEPIYTYTAPVNPQMATSPGWVGPLTRAVAVANRKAYSSPFYPSSTKPALKTEPVIKAGQQPYSKSAVLPAQLPIQSPSFMQDVAQAQQQDIGNLLMQDTTITPNLPTPTPKQPTLPGTPGQRKTNPDPFKNIKTKPPIRKVTLPSRSYRDYQYGKFPDFNLKQSRPSLLPPTTTTRKKKRSGYSPSLFSSFFNYKAKLKPEDLVGIGIRPIPLTREKRSKRKRQRK